MNKPEGEDFKPILITNKHVIKDAEEGMLTLTILQNGMIAGTEKVEIPFSGFESFWVPHPDDSVDLCMLNFKTVEMIMTSTGKQFFYLPLNLDMIPDSEAISRFDTMEEVMMIGYPNGIWDSYNNKPIFRKGVTATDLRLDYEGKGEFLIDMAVFGGSSGSPILYTNSRLESQMGGVANIRQLYLVGILYAGFQHRANGEIRVVEIPQTQRTIIETSVPNNLGIAIKANKLLDFRKMLYGK